MDKGLRSQIKTDICILPYTYLHILVKPHYINHEQILRLTRGYMYVHTFTTDNFFFFWLQGPQETSIFPFKFHLFAFHLNYTVLWAVTLSESQLLLKLVCIFIYPRLPVIVFSSWAQWWYLHLSLKGMHTCVVENLISHCWYNSCPDTWCKQNVSLSPCMLLL